MTHAFIKKKYLWRGIVSVAVCWLYTFYIDYKLITADMERTALWAVIVFAAISLVGKAASVLNEFHKLSVFRKSYVITDNDKVIYHLHRAWHKRSRVHYVEFEIDAVRKVFNGNAGGFDLRGRFEGIYYGQDGRTELFRKTRRNLLIPGIYNNMEEVERVLNSMCPPESEKDTLFF